MRCERWREALSAMSDGEPTGIDARLVDAHVARCAGCRAYRDDIEALRPLRVQAAPSMPDLSGRVVKVHAMADRARAWGAVRVLLATVAVQIIVLSLRELVFAGASPAPAHEARHLGAFSVAYAVGLLVVVVRPARARSILPVAGVLAGALSITAVVDIADGRVPLVGEAIHLPEVLSVVLVWLLAAGSRRAGRPERAGATRFPGLRVAGRDERAPVRGVG